ncbi:hypothetical protein HDU93_003695, partial [Gonapodya sp. JEL0774]
MHFIYRRYPDIAKLISNSLIALKLATSEDAPILAQLTCLVSLSQTRPDLFKSLVGRALRNFFPPAPTAVLWNHNSDHGCKPSSSATLDSLESLDEARVLRFVVSETSSGNNPRVFARVKIGDQKQIVRRDAFVKLARDKYNGIPPPGVSVDDLASVD